VSPAFEFLRVVREEREPQSRPAALPSNRPPEPSAGGCIVVALKKALPQLERSGRVAAVRGFLKTSVVVPWSPVHAALRVINHYGEEILKGTPVAYVSTNVATMAYLAMEKRGCVTQAKQRPTVAGLLSCGGLPVGAFALDSWLGEPWLLLPIAACLVVVVFGIGVLNIPADLDAIEETEVRLAVYSIAIAMVLLPIVAYITRRLYGSAWGMAAAAAIPAMIIAMPHALLAAAKVRAELRWRRASRHAIRKHNHRDRRFADTLINLRIKRRRREKSKGNPGGDSSEGDASGL
jgi:hypothetical protein